MWCINHSGHRLEGSKVLNAARSPAGFLFDLANCSYRRLFILVEDAPGEFPTPLACSEAMTPKHQDILMYVKDEG